jgi:hypothetical protein
MLIFLTDMMEELTVLVCSTLVTSGLHGVFWNGLINGPVME